jgi:NAD(P)-dependent dehydrogenase (short-subunit alcohol dehydrogenase family)
VTAEAIDRMSGVFTAFQPLPHAGMPDDIARAALWLASDDASFVTGQAVAVDGGYTAGKPWDKWPQFFRERGGTQRS